MQEIKAHFKAPELFMFYHGCKSYIKYGYNKESPRKHIPSWDEKPYSIKFKEINIRAKFNYKNYHITLVRDEDSQETLIKGLIGKEITLPIEKNLTNIVEYYFSFIYELERLDIIKPVIHRIELLKPE